MESIASIRCSRLGHNSCLQRNIALESLIFYSNLIGSPLIECQYSHSLWKPCPLYKGFLPRSMEKNLYNLVNTNIKKRGGSMANTQKTYALLLGIILAVIGIWGLFTNNILGIFGVNTFHSILHLIAGAFGIYVGTRGEGPTYNMTIGWIGVALAILGWIPGINTLLVNLINLSPGDNWLHIVIGVVSLGVYYGASK